MLRAAAGAGILVLPDAGCGVFGNAPEAVGAALGKALRQCSCVGRVVIASPGGKAGESFYEAAKKAYGS